MHRIDLKDFIGTVDLIPGHDNCRIGSMSDGSNAVDFHYLQFDSREHQRYIFSNCPFAVYGLRIPASLFHSEEIAEGESAQAARL